MTRLELPNPCLEILCWLESRPAEPSIALGDGCGVLSDLFKTTPTATKQQWEDWLRILDGQQAILVQLFTSRLLATSFFDPEDGLYGEWESPSRRIGSGHPWSAIVSMGWPGYMFTKALIKGDIRPHLVRTYQRLTANHPTLVQPKDICRLYIPRISLTEHGRVLLALEREEGRDPLNTKVSGSLPKVSVDQPIPPDYWLVSRLMQTHPIDGVDTDKARARFLENHPEIRVISRPRRLFVNVSDWLEAGEKESNKASGGKSGGDPSPAEINAETQKIRGDRHRKRM